MMLLVDTNIFLEILMEQRREEKCRRILKKHKGEICLSDFSLHSIGIFLFRLHMEDEFAQFVRDFLSYENIIGLTPDRMSEVVEVKREFGLDFDDSYQYLVARSNNLKFLTMDRDFEKTEGIDISFVT